jgi:hypothetical protein
MPFTPSFSAAQTYGLPSVIKLTDTSTGTDVAVTSRRVYLQQYNGSYLVPIGTTTDYIVWSLASSTISIDVLTKDTALQVLVQWLDIGGNVLYTSTGLYGFTLYNEQFLYDLTQDQTGKPGIIQDQVYYDNKMKLRVEIDSGDQALSLANDITGAQYAYDRATELRVNQNNYF